MVYFKITKLSKSIVAIMVFLSGNIQNYPSPKTSNSITLPIYKDPHQEPNKKNPQKNIQKNSHHLRKTEISDVLPKPEWQQNLPFQLPFSKNYRRCSHTPVRRLSFCQLINCCFSRGPLLQDR